MGLPFLGDPAELDRLALVNDLVRRCPHRRESTCAGYARCALGRGRGGRVSRRDCQECKGEEIDASPVPDPDPVPAPASTIVDTPSAPDPAPVSRPSLPSSPVLFDARDRPVDLAGSRSGRAVALFCGGPSLGSLDLSPFLSPWCDRAAVNNAGALVRPHWWFCVDDPRKFHDSIWLDPNCWKFACRNHRRHQIRSKRGGVFRDAGRMAFECPQVAFYRRHARHDHRSWVGEEVLSWGCGARERCSLGLEGCRSVMFVALKILLVLGYTRIFLLGCDWKMDADGAQYGFGQSKDARACASNNGSYRVNGRRLAALRPEIEAIGAEVVNANPASHLGAFAKCTPEDAAAAIDAANRPELDLEGWY